MTHPTPTQNPFPRPAELAIARPGYHRITRFGRAELWVIDHSGAAHLMHWTHAERTNRDHVTGAPLYTRSPRATSRPPVTPQSPARYAAAFLADRAMETRRRLARIDRQTGPAEAYTYARDWAMSLEDTTPDPHAAQLCPTGWDVID